MDIDTHEVAKLLKGLEVKVYQGKSYPSEPGPWHAHVTGLKRGDLEGLRMRPTISSAEEYAYVIERKVSEGLSLGEALSQTPSATHVTVLGDNKDWTEVGYCSSEDEAREHACIVVGHVFAVRLAKRTGPKTIPAQVVPGEKVLVFS